MERTLLLLDKTSLATPRPLLFIATLGQQAKEWASDAVFQLRQRDIPAETDHQGSSLKSQMRRADRLGADFVLIVGEDEMEKGRIILRNMRTKDQMEVDLSDWLEACQKRLCLPPTL